MANTEAPIANESVEIEVLELLGKLTGLHTSWQMKEQLLSQLSCMLQQHPVEADEAILCARPAAVVDTVMALMVSGRTQPSSKLLAADVLSMICSNSKAYLLLCPSSVVERLMSCAYKGNADVKAAAARALWQLSCHNDFSPEVVNHAGNAFKVVELLAEDIQGSSSACMCALRATQNLLHTYAHSTAGDAEDRIGGRLIGPLCNLLEPTHPEAAAAAAELLALLALTPANRARILAAGGIPRLVALMRQGAAASSNTSSHSTATPYTGLHASITQAATSFTAAAPAVVAETGRPQQQQQVLSTNTLQEAAAQAALQALVQLARSDVQLCLELLGAHVMSALLQLLSNGRCCGGALSLLGDLASLPEGRRALQYADGFAALSEVAEVCPAVQLCRLLSKATKGSTATSHDLAALQSSPTLITALVRCCCPADRKTCKRAMQVLLRLLEHCKAAGTMQQLQQQLLRLGLLQQLLEVLSLWTQQRSVAAAAPQPSGVPKGSSSSGGSSATNSSSSSSSQGSVLEVQLAVALLHAVAACPEMLYSCSTAAAAAGGVSSSSSKYCCGDSSTARQQGQQQQDNQSSHAQQPAAAVGTMLDPPACTAAIADAIIAAPSFVWKHPAAAAAAFGDMTALLPDIPAAICSGADTQAAQAVKPLNPVLPHLLWQLQQVLLSPVLHLPSLQQQVLQVVAAIAAPRHADVLGEMVRQGWVQVLWAFLPGGRQLLAVTLTQLIQQQQQGKQTAGQQQQQQSMPSEDGTAAAAAMQAGGQRPKGSRSSSLQPHLLQLLDESLPSVEQTLHALQALACVSSHPGAAVIAVQLQASYQAASANGMLTVPVATYLGAAGSAPGSASTTPTATAAAVAAGGLAAVLFGSSSGGRGSPRAVSGTKTGPGVTTQPQSPRTVTVTSPISFANHAGSSSSSSSGCSTVGSFVAVGAPVSSSLTASSSIGDLPSSSSSMRRSSSAGLLSRLGITRQKSVSAAPAAAAAAAPHGSRSRGPGGSDTPSQPAAAAAAYDQSAPVEDPGSPIQLLVTLLGEQWAATAAAELLAHMSAAGPAVCIPAMLEQGVTGTLAECMREIQPNSAGAGAALSTLLLVQQLGQHCPEQVHASGIVDLVLHMLEFDCKDAAPAAAAASSSSSSVRAASLRVLAALCGHGGHNDRHLCATVARAALLPLLQWLCSSADDAASNAAAVLNSLLECGAVDGAAIAAAKSDKQKAGLVTLCLKCLFSDHKQQQQQQRQLTAVRLLRAFVELDGRLVEAFLEAEGLPKLTTMLSAAVAAGNSSSSSIEQQTPPVAAAAHCRLMMQYEIMAILDSLSLCHRRVLVQAAIIPIIVGILRQQQQQQQAAAQVGNSSSSNSTSRSLSRRATSKAPGAASGVFAAGMTSDELLLRCKVIACNLITVLAINNDVKRQLFNSDAVGPLMQLADAVSEGSKAQEAIRAALAQLGLVYLLPAPAAPADHLQT